MGTLTECRSPELLWERYLQYSELYACDAIVLAYFQLTPQPLGWEQMDESF